MVGRQVPLNFVTPNSLASILKVQGISDWSIERIVEQSLCKATPNPLSSLIVGSSLLIPAPCTLRPEPSTLNPEPCALNPAPRSTVQGYLAHKVQRPPRSLHKEYAYCSMVLLGGGGCFL